MSQCLKLFTNLCGGRWVRQLRGREATLLMRYK